MDPSLSALKQLTLEARVYMNSFQTSDNSGGFYLGASYGGGRPLDGYIAEARVWYRALIQAR